MNVFYFVFELYERDPRFVDKIVVTESYNGMLKTAYNRYQRGRTSDNCQFLRAFVGLVVLHVDRRLLPWLANQFTFK